MSGIRMTARRVSVLALALYALTAAAQPQLTTIQDTVYLADGRLFQGAVTVEYKSFLAADNTNVAAYNKNTRIVNGVLKLSLIPTTTASAGAYYIARYLVTGRLQFTEYWAVPPASGTIKLKDVRLSAPPLPGQQVPSNAPAGLGTVLITDVIGLPDELAARAQKGIGYAPSHTAIINSAGDLDGAVGDPTDCVRVNGTTGPCSVSNSPAFIDGEAPAGLVNGSNAVFTLSNGPNPASSLALYRNGVLQTSGTDYTILTNTITFLTASKPQPSDLLTASYRISGVSGETGGLAGGALVGYFPAPSIAPNAIANQHIADNAAIAESKIALNFPTHSNANDPTTDQKGALAGTMGQPTGNNRFVTDSDARLSNSRPPSTHALLSGAHFDTNPEAVSRGDLLTGTGTSPTLWTRLPLGAPNRCLSSNGFDVVWNACLFTGFPAGAIPFVDSTGILAHNQSRLFWNNSTRRLAIGHSAPTATLSLYDASAGTGQTTMSVRAGDGQANVALQSWQDAAGNDLARIEANGSLLAVAVRSSSSSAQPAWQETGSATDPSAASNGGSWLNTTESTRKTKEGGQVHTAPQVICSTAGTGTSATSLQVLGSCQIPVALVRPGDRFEVLTEISHEGSSAGFSYSLVWAGTILSARGASALDTGVSGKAFVIPQSGGIYWSWQDWGSAAALQAGNGTASLSSGAVTVQVKGQLAGTASDTATLRNLSIVRIPGQQN